MEPVNNSPDTASLVPHGPHLPDANAKVPTFKAATVQMLVSQPEAVLSTLKKTPDPLTEASTTLPNRKTELPPSARSESNYESKFGPVYTLNDGKKTASDPVWELDESTEIRGVNFGQWPLKLSVEQVRAYIESGRANVLNNVPDIPDQQESSRPIPSLELRLPETDTRRSWLEYFDKHPGQLVEDGLAQAFGPEGARYLRDQLDQLSTGNEQVQQWQEICKLLSLRATSGLPYRPSQDSPKAGKGEKIILEMMFVQENVNKLINTYYGPTVINTKARNWRIKMGNFLKNAGIDGDLAYLERWITVYRGGGIPKSQLVDPGSVQFFLTTTQTRQLFTSLRSFVMDQVSGSIE